MNIGRYTSYFHDGSVIDICHGNSILVLSIESAEISVEENLDNIPLSDRLTIKGKLHLEKVDFITDNEKPISAPLRMLYDSAGILHFKIRDTTVSLDLEWVNFPPHARITAYSFYTISAKKIWWENIPDLRDPFA
jgi:hypothetical protein